MNVAQTPTQPLPEVFLALPEHVRATCAGPCGRPVVRRQTLLHLAPDVRAELKAAGIVGLRNRGLCATCLGVITKEGRLEEFITPEWKPPVLEDEYDIPALWQEVLDSGGGYRELAKRLDVDQKVVYDAIGRLGLTRPPRQMPFAEQRAERDYFLEELTHLTSCGRGVHEIAQAFSLTDQQLIDKVHRLQRRGLTTIRFDDYALEEAA